MKRFITLIATLFVALSLSAQNVENIRFLGIPIDGTKANMIAQLKDKGFDVVKTSDGDEVLVGDFNGRKSNIFVHTNRNKVDRIMVAYANNVDEAQIKIDYNNLLRQFKNNEKYTSLEEWNPIPDDEDISYEILVHKKRYDTSFYAMPEVTEEIEKALEEKGKGMTDEEVAKMTISWAYEQLTRGEVWFTIHEYGYNQYGISIYYDNLRNRPNGDEL